MPSRRLNRFWCTKCQEYTLHEVGEDGGCTICGTVTSEYFLKDVPLEKLMEQRERYKRAKSKKMMGFYQSMLTLSNSNIDILAENPNVEIHETDAGQKAIDQRRKDLLNKKIEEHKELKREYKEKFSNTDRNETCPCGSGKKYKKCCLNRFLHV
jgi:hypothetical protein